MNNERHASTPLDRRLTLGEIIARRVVPTTMALGTVATALYSATEATAERGHQPELSQQTIQSTVMTGEFREGEAPQETAMHLIKAAVEKATDEVFNNGSVDKSAEVVKMIDNLPVYHQANEALSIAGYGDTLPDAGDKLEIELGVIVDDEGLSYEVMGAEIIDLENNQE